MKLWIVLAVSMFCMVLAASEERILNPCKVSISADAGKPFGDVTVEIVTNKNEKDLKIISIRIKIHGKWKKIPERAFADLKSPLLNNVQIRTETGYDDSPWLYIFFKLGHYDKNGKWNPKRVHIFYHKGHFERRSITTPESDFVSQCENIDLNKE